MSYQALHPYDKKQNVNLALALFHDTTIAACKCYLPDRSDMASFLKLINVWWTISYSNRKFDINPLGSAVTADHGKLNFLEEMADFIEEWNKSPHFCLSKQTAHALITTLRAHAMLMKDLFEDGYQYVMTRRLQSDPIENRFSQYRQMSGGRFLVSLREVLSSERILACRSLLKAGIDIWNQKDEDGDPQDLQEFLSSLSEHETEIMEASLSDESSEVALLIAGYVCWKKDFEEV